MSVFGKLFGRRDLELFKLRAKVLSLKFHHAIICKRMSYLESRHPEIFQHLINKESPVARLRDSEKQKIMQDVDTWLEGLK